MMVGYRLLASTQKLEASFNGLLLQCQLGKRIESAEADQ
jgi:hypothetical protein